MQWYRYGRIPPTGSWRENAVDMTCACLEARSLIPSHHNQWESLSLYWRRTITLVPSHWVRLDFIASNLTFPGCHQYPRLPWHSARPSEIAERSVRGPLRIPFLGESSRYPILQLNDLDLAFLDQVSPLPHPLLTSMRPRGSLWRFPP